MDLSDISEDLILYVDEGGFVENADETIAQEDEDIIVGVTDEVTDEVVKLASRLTDQLIQHRGCCSGCHKQSQGEHTEKYASHYSLQEYLDRIQSAVNYPDILGLEAIASWEDNLASQTTAAVKRQIYCGLAKEDPTSTLVHICLEARDRPTMAAGVTFDVDSITRFPASLGIGKQGIR